MAFGHFIKMGANTIQNNTIQYFPRKPENEKGPYIVSIGTVGDNVYLHYSNGIMKHLRLNRSGGKGLKQNEKRKERT